MTEKTPIAVLGAGSWGTALAILLSKNGFETRLWGRDQAQIEAMDQARENSRYLPGIPFPPTLIPCVDLAQAVAGLREILVVVPSSGFRATLAAAAAHTAPGVRVAWATKGLEHGSRKLLHDVTTEVLGGEVPKAVISGPTFAKEVAAGLPTAVTVASTHEDFAAHLAGRLANETFRAYTSSDVVGVELGGSVKNVLAIGAGIADGLGFGANSRAALITRGLAEIKRLGVALGGRLETFMGLAGLGDLVLTCTDNQSRNRRLGLALGQGRQLDDALQEIGQVAEGAYAAKEVYTLATELGIEMPISEQVYNVLYTGQDPREAVHALLTRALKPEDA